VPTYTRTMERVTSVALGRILCCAVWLNNSNLCEILKNSDGDDTESWLQEELQKEAFEALQREMRVKQWHILKLTHQGPAPNRGRSLICVIVLL